MAEEVLILMAGRVKVSLVDSEGNTLVLAIRGPGEVLGEIALLDGATRSATVTAIDLCEVQVLAIDVFVRLMHSFDLESMMIRYAVRRFRESEALRLELAALPARERVLRGLLRLAMPSMPSTPIDAVVDIGLDQTEFGQAVGLSRGSVADKLAELRSLGVISTQRGRIVVNDMALLRDLAVKSPRD
jgi:CRP/FNR family cyclic AMP-dependent transcriptional regulator